MKDQKEPGGWLKFQRLAAPGFNDPSQPRPVWLHYALATLAVGLSVLIKLGLTHWLDPQLEPSATFAVFFSAITFSAWFGGFSPGLFATFLALVLTNYFFIPPSNTFGFNQPGEVVISLLFLIEGIIISLLCMQLRRALQASRQELNSRRELEARLREERERFAVTLASIGDGVIATDAEGRISFINQVAAALTGWPSAEANGRKLEEVFKIINEQSRQPVTSPVARVLQSGAIVGLTNHTVLVTRDGRELPIDDSGAPLRLAGGEVIGIVLVFRDVTERRQIEAERNRLFANEQSARQQAELARDRLGRLQAATVEFSRALTTAQVAQVVLEQAVGTLAADAGVIALFDTLEIGAKDEADPQLKIVHTVGYSPAELEQWQRFSLNSSIPITEAIRRGQPTWFGSLEETLTHFPALNAASLRGEARANIPLKGEDDKVVGALSLRFNQPHRFEELERRFVLTLAEQAAQALERARLYEIEQKARQEAEANQKRLIFLAEASRALASSLDYELTLQNIARLAVPAFADWSVVDLVGPDKRLMRVVAVHQNPAKQTLLLEFEKRYPPDPNAPYGYPKVIRTGEAELLPYITEAMLEASAKDAGQLAMLRELGLQSNLCVPMIRRGQILGALSFATAESGRHYNEADLALAEELGQRAALALDNARLYRQTQLALQDRETALNLHRQREEQLNLLVEAAGSLVSSLDLDKLLATILDLSNRLIEADAYALWRYESARQLWRPVVSAGLSQAYRETNLQEYESDRIFDQPIIAPLVEEAPALASRLESYHAEGIRSMLVVPLPILGQNSGSLAFYFHRPHSFSPLETGMASALANLAAAALGNAELYRQAQQAVQVRDEFLSVAAHELKTPITSQRGFTQILLRQLDKDTLPNPAQLRRTLDTINQQSQKLERLIGQLLDISRLEGAKLTLERQEVDLGALVEQVSAIMQTRTTLHTINLRVPSPMLVWLDPLRIEQVLINLLDNAIKYSPDGGQIVVKLTTPSPDTVQLSVTDQGIGVAPTHREHLFDRFYQAHAENYYGGMGLGLYISREIVELHGGQLEAEFPPEGGTRFIMTLPRNLPQEIAAK